MCPFRAALDLQKQHSVVDQGGGANAGQAEI